MKLSIEHSGETGEEIFNGYKCDITDLFDWIKSNNFKAIAIQLPEGLMVQAQKLYTKLESELKITVILMGDQCFGACDIAAAKLKHLGADALVHIGHTEIPNCHDSNIPIKYVELQSNIDPSTLIRGNILKTLRSEFQPASTIGLVANIQFIPYLDKIRSILENEGFQVLIGTGDERLKYSGQVIGCNFSAAKSIESHVEGFLFIGDGTFHPLGVSLATHKTVLAFDPISDTAQNISSLKEKILRQRSGAIARLKETACQNYGIIISTKPGQNRYEYGIKLKSKLEEHGYTGVLIAMEHVSPDMLDYLPFDAYINTACPRLTIDDYMRFKKVILTPIELGIILGERAWDKYVFDEIR